MILATADRDQTVVLGDPKAHLPAGRDSPVTKADSPLTAEEIGEYSRIKCCVCGARVLPEEVAEHSRHCVLDPAPNLRLQLDKWCIASANMTLSEQRAFLHMRRTEELAQVNDLEAELSRRMTKLWWMSGRFGYIISAKWLREWRSFVGVGRPTMETRDRPPGPVNNNDLFELDGSLRSTLREGVQYEYHVVEPPKWHFFVQVYGGGTPVLRYNASGCLPALSDQVAEFEGDWRDLRPDTGHGKVFDPYSSCGFDGEIRGGFLWSCTGKGLLRNGSHFEGQVVEGHPHGRGREVRPDGTILEGQFHEGKLHGFGRTTEPQGRLIEGEWEHGELLGI